MVSLGEYFNGVQIVYIVDDLEPSDEIFPFWKHENNSYDIFAKIYFEQYWKFKVWIQVCPRSKFDFVKFQSHNLIKIK